VDYLNLYVKNLDSEVDNNELFSLFKTYGHIVSARVMTHPATGQSKGYGFVSYGSPDEAGLALEQMNGFSLRGRALLVNYHETKKPRQEKSTSTTTSSFHSPPAVDYLHTSYDNYQGNY
jgi:RNA recognition motif-containing protein